MTEDWVMKEWKNFGLTFANSMGDLLFIIYVLNQHGVKKFSVRKELGGYTVEDGDNK